MTRPRDRDCPLTSLTSINSWGPVRLTTVTRPTRNSYIETKTILVHLQLSDAMSNKIVLLVTLALLSALVAAQATGKPLPISIELYFALLMIQSCQQDFSTPADTEQSHHPRCCRCALHPCCRDRAFPQAAPLWRHVGSARHVRCD